MYLVSGEALIDCLIDTENYFRAMHFDARVGGSPFNVAIGIARFGGESSLLTGVSTDMFGCRLMRAIEHENVTTRYLLRSTRPTTLVIVGMDEKGQPAYVMYGEDAADRCVTTEPLPVFGEEVSGFHCGSCSLAVTPVADTLASIAAAALLAVYGKPKEVVSALDGTRLKALLTFTSAAASITCTRRGAELPYRHNVALG
jgi:fructokinase